ncbi:shikimate kinase [Leuconostoc carnosum]|uniref:Shikimate kinase n=2 Tax=Leuconostoc carnosum TaxID=1252 RepID=K0DAG4_LEUCJ|nr:shikimate kinase [Leuconostoc carnosum]AFT81820.1 shikimate kinase [Leuconostoc carnosum JB16]KAA8328405.1 shikimate kinase [Leuconostoc carnosum]QEA32701.1 shikimate kinase [Leuconostoc carnosum]
MSKEPDTLMLVGFMGAGKTTVGKEIARQHHSKFIDIDSEIEREAGMSIRAIFQEYGESGFRDLETKVLANVQTFDGIVATGGGVVEREDNMAILHESPATVIYLHGNLESTIGRLLIEGQRPLLEEKSAAEFFRLWAQRDPKYQSVANFMVETIGKTPERIAAEIVALFSSNEDELALLQLRSEIDAFDRQIFGVIEKRMQTVEAVAKYKEKFGMPTVQQGRMTKMRKLLKYDFENSEDVTDDMIDKIMAILTDAAINKENKQLKR